MRYNVIIPKQKKKSELILTYDKVVKVFPLRLDSIVVEFEVPEPFEYIYNAKHDRTFDVFIKNIDNKITKPVPIKIHSQNVPNMKG